MKTSDTIKTMKIRACVLCRVSSKEQSTEGYSLQAQEKLLTEHAFKHGFAED